MSDWEGQRVTFGIEDAVGQGFGRGIIKQEIQILSGRVSGSETRTVPPTLRVSDRTKLSIRSSS